ncbi:unnamed protein product [Ectocarpus sp. 6 AP-2014]
METRSEEGLFYGWNDELMRELQSVERERDSWRESEAAQLDRYREAAQLAVVAADVACPPFSVFEFPADPGPRRPKKHTLIARTIETRNTHDPTGTSTQISGRQ